MGKVGKVRSRRGWHRGWKKWEIWNRGEWTKIDRKLRRAQRQAEKDELRRELKDEQDI